MTKEKPHLPWPGEDDRAVVEKMLRDPQSEQWAECRAFVEKLVHQRAKNIPQDSWEDIAQDAMRKIIGSLPAFQYRCSLTTWIFGIVHRCIIDEYRKFIRITQYQESLDESELSDAFTGHSTSVTPEVVFIISEEVKQIVIAIKEYISSHNKPERNRRILDMVLREGRSLEEAAKVVGCSSAVAGYVVRSAKRYIRKKLGE